jgi:two-component system response regulator VicR
MAYRIFLVDDDRFLLDLYMVKFKNAGHDVTAFNSGAEFLAAIKKEGATAPDAVLLDIIMPGVGGFEVLETVRKENLIPSAKLIVLSNQGLDADIEKAKEYKVDGYIVKASAIPSEVLTEAVRIIEAGKPAA